MNYENNSIKKIPDCCIKVKKRRICAVCGKPTFYVEYCVETTLCSNECISKFYKEIFPEEN